MNTLKQILEKPWEFTVYLFNDDKYVIEVAFFEQIIDYTVFYYLSDEDIKNISDINYFSNLVNKIKKERNKFESREVRGTGIYDIRD